MVALSKVKAGEVYYSVERQKMGNTTIRRDVTFTIRVTEVVLDDAGEVQHVMASWNGNSARQFGPRSIQKWRVNKPASKPDPWDQARATMTARLSPSPSKQEG